MRLYHATGSRYLQGILQDGLRCRGDELDNQWPTQETRDDLVYLTKCFGPIYARHVTNETDEQWLILELNVTDHDKLLPDDAYGAVLASLAGDEPDEIRQKEKAYRRHLEDHRSDWESSLSTIGNVACESDFSTSDLRRYCLVDPALRRELVHVFVEQVQSTNLPLDVIIPYFEQLTAWFFGDCPRLPEPPMRGIENISDIVDRESADRAGIRVVYRRGRPMYFAHPSGNSLGAGLPRSLVAATQNRHYLHFNDLLEMHSLVRELAACFNEVNPDLVPFFATGGIPYIVPLLYVLSDQGVRLADHRIFHMFPGLKWNGLFQQVESREFFAKTFGELIRQHLVSHDIATILVVDTTNTGNAVNEATKAVANACKAKNIASDKVRVKLVGIVNCQHPTSQLKRDGVVLVKGAKRKAYLIPPSGFVPSGELADRQFVAFRRPEDGFVVEISYWLAGNIPTEDEADLLGVHANHDELSVTTDIRPGRLVIKYANGRNQERTGGSTVGQSLNVMLGKELDKTPWPVFFSNSRLPPKTTEEVESNAESDQLAGLRFFDLGQSNDETLEDELLKLPRKLSAEEIWWLAQRQQVPKRLVGKVTDSLREDENVNREAVGFLRRALPELAVDDPMGESSRDWWLEKLERK